MGVLLLCCAKGTQLAVEAEGDQAELAVQEIGKLIDSGFEEGE
jgi:phosphotransferase system HPr-like phosphotransfer protein